LRSVRPERVASLIRQELARLLLFESKDPGLAGIVLTDARVSADLRIAWIRYQLHDASEEGRAVAREGLSRASRFLRSSLKDRLSLRIMPELRFEYDDRSGAGSEIEAILRQVRGADGDGGQGGQAR
jgi:ribosome-binding factor A